MVYTAADEQQTPTTRPAIEHSLTVTVDPNFADFAQMFYDVQNNHFAASGLQPDHLRDASITDARTNPDGTVSLTFVWSW
jgi:hypothetical protein